MDRHRNRSRDKHSRSDSVNRKAGVLAAVYVAVLAINLDVTIVNVALPSIATQLHADTRGLQWVVDGYNLTFAALVLAAGSLSDRYGRRPALLIGLLGFAVTSALGALATSTGALVAARFSMGVFAALIFPTTLSIITNTFSDRRQRATALGGWGAVVGAGAAAGPVTGGLLLEHFSWSSVFLQYVAETIESRLRSVLRTCPGPGCGRVGGRILRRLTPAYDPAGDRATSHR
jgi:MFS family permease